MVKEQPQFNGVAVGSLVVTIMSCIQDKGVKCNRLM